MSFATAVFPVSVWDGTSATHDVRADDKSPDYVTGDQYVAEIIALQTVVFEHIDLVAPLREVGLSGTILSSDGLGLTYRKLLAGSNISIIVNGDGDFEISATSIGGGGDDTAYLKRDGTRALTAHWDVGDFNITARQLISDVADGTAPFVVSSTTVVENLNAEYLAGNPASAFALVGHNHDAAYAAIGHNHDSSYAPLEHNHDSLYAAIAHNHDGTYSLAGHNHAGVYSPVEHTHSVDDLTDFDAALDEQQDLWEAADVIVGLNAHDYTDTEIAALSSVYAVIGHNHDATYAALSHTHDDRYYTESEITTLLAGKAAATHSHAISDVTGLQTALDGKAASSHTHTIANITSLQTTLDDKINKAGTVAFAANQAMGGFKITGAADPSADGDYATRKWVRQHTVNDIVSSTIYTWPIFQESWASGGGGGADQGITLSVRNGIATAPMECRLTTSAGPYSAVDDTGSSTLYLRPVYTTGGKVALYDTTNARWETYTVDAASPISVSAPTAVATTYDVFVSLSGSSLVLTFEAWSTVNTGRPTLDIQDGILVLASNKAKRLIGTVTVWGNLFIDSDQRRLVANLYNRIPKRLHIADATQHTYTGSARNYNGSGSNFVDAVFCLSTDLVFLEIRGGVGNNASASAAFIGISAKNTSTFSTYQVTFNQAGSLGSSSGLMTEAPGVGRHYYFAMQTGGASSVFSSMILGGWVWV